MRIYTAHTHPRKPPVLIPEAFSWAALFFGPLWLLRHGAWITGLVTLAMVVAICTAAPPGLRPPLAFALFVLLGMFGNDLRRWSLSRSRFQLAHIVAARSRDEAFLRLLAHRSDLVGLSA